MADLTKEYTDIKEIKHKVEHHLASTDDNSSKERIFAELFNALTRSRRHVSA